MTLLTPHPVLDHPPRWPLEMVPTPSVDRSDTRAEELGLDTSLDRAGIIPIHIRCFSYNHDHALPACVSAVHPSRRRARRAVAPERARAREIYKELIEINTTDTPAGNVTKAAEAVAARLKAAGLSRRRHAGARARSAEGQPRRALSRGTGAASRCCSSRTSTSSRRSARTGRSIRSRSSRRTAASTAAAPATTRRWPSQFVANLIRLKEEGFTPDRDLILALTADEEGGTFNGVDWLVKNHRDLIDAEFAINEGGGGTMRKGKYLTNEVQASEKVYQDFQLEVTNSGGHSSLPVKDNAIYHLVAGARAPGGVRVPGPAERGDARATSSGRRRSRADPKLAADMRAVARPTPDLAAAARLSASLPYCNSMMRTTCVATRLAGGHANNALPQLATANVNCRILPGVSPDVGQGDARRGRSPIRRSRCRSSTRRTPSKPSPLRPDVHEPRSNRSPRRCSPASSSCR